MARFEVFRFPVASSQLVLDVQADLLDGLTTRIVVPLLPVDIAPPALHRLNPKVVIESKSYVFAVQYIASIPTSALKTPIANLHTEADIITASLDMLFQGF